MRIIDAVLEAESLFRKATITDTPRLDAEVLLADLLGVGRATLLARYSEALEKTGREEYTSRIMRRVRGEPVAYITGKKEFMGHTFHVDARALVPRPETEMLVERVVDAFQSVKCEGGSLADIGAGSGCIAVSLALMLPRAAVYASDISEEAIELAGENAELHRVSERITFCAGDLYSAYPSELKGVFDVVVSNPPYVSDSEYLALDHGIREFEPPLALRGGEDGLAMFRRIVEGAADYLADSGFLAVEIGENQAAAAKDILACAGAFTAIECARDLSGKQRIITGWKIP